MELDDLKKSWEDASNQTKQQSQLTATMIDEITKGNFERRIKKISYAEIGGTIICVAGVLYVIANFFQLNTIFLQVTGLVAIVILISISALSIASIRQFNLPADVNKPYAATVKDFALQKLRFLKLQKINLMLCYLLLVVTIILLSKFFGGKDIASNKNFWIFSFCFGYIFLLFYSKWVARFYKNSLNQAEEILKGI